MSLLKPREKIKIETVGGMEMPQKEGAKSNPGDAGTVAWPTNPLFLTSLTVTDFQVK